jgi:hypothetical protein
LILTILFVSACKNLQGQTNLCTTFKPITITEEERVQLISIDTLRQIDDFNQEWIIRCE